MWHAARFALATAVLAGIVLVGGAADKVAYAAKKFPPIAAPMYLSAYASMVTRRPDGAVKPLSHLVAADPELADARNALALALIASDPNSLDTAHVHAKRAVELAPDVPQFVVTFIVTDRGQWKIGPGGKAYLTRAAAVALKDAAQRLKSMPGNAKKLADLLKSIEETGADAEFPFVFDDYDKLLRSPNLALTRPEEDTFSVAQKVIEEKIRGIRDKAKVDQKVAEEDKKAAELRQQEISQQVAVASERQREREAARMEALAKLRAAASEAAASAKRLAELTRRQELMNEASSQLSADQRAAEDERLVTERRKAIEAEDAARKAREELALLAKAEEEARKEQEALVLAQQMTAERIAEAEQRARVAEQTANASMEQLMAQIAEQQEILDALLDSEPPIIQITSAPDVVELGSGAVQIAGVIGDEAGAPRDLSVNGQSMPLFKLDSGDKPVAAFSNTFRVDFTPSREGRQTLTFEVVDAAGNKATQEVVIQVAVANRPSIQGKNFALIIGNNDYEKLPHLKTAVNDAEVLAAVLRDKYLFEEGNVRLLTNATRRDIMAELSRLRRTMSEEDRLVLYYAGHGQIDPATDEGFWQPVDAEPDSDFTWISNADVKRYLSGMLAKHILIVADSCFSGSLTRGGTTTDNVDKFFANIDKYPSRKVISSGGTEPVADTGSGGHSVFAYYLIKTLRDNEQPYITSFQLYDRLAKAVTNNSSQTPEFGSVPTGGDQGNGDFTFIRRPQG